jgi:acyl-[acyl-carrier-protein]-phospholipid O-acyltransferase / long-chain-fatty-acid--[acyl-carrier-protein] ligase
VNTAPSPVPFDADTAAMTVFSALLDAARRHGPDKAILEDHERQPLTYKRLILASLVLGDKLAAQSRRSEAVGVLLPTANGMAVTLFGLNAFGRVGALLNYTAGLRNLRAALATGVIRTVVTSRRFVGLAKLDDVVAGLAEIEATPGHKTRIVYLEDVRGSIGAVDKARGLIRSYYAGRLHGRHALRTDQPAVILFTSGTEGAPKGVVLSNGNLVANARQIFTHAKGMLSPADTVLNPLPMFHSFGLTAATLMPLLSGMRTVLYPSPLHYKEVPALVGKTAATVLFATDTFMQGYARAAAEGDLKTVRYVVAGAERVKDQTRAMWDRFGTIVLEGYGATECSPVLACNLPTSNGPGTVGPLLPGIEARLDPVDGIAEGGKLMVRGPNVMLGYMLADKPGVVVPPTDGWHDTGDIVAFDAALRIAIKGRAKRFAKLGGEMISLAAVEGMITELWPEHNHVVVSVPDARKGEQLILVTDRADAARDPLLHKARAAGVPELWVPRQIMAVPSIPLLSWPRGRLTSAADDQRSRRGTRQCQRLPTNLHLSPARHVDPAMIRHATSGTVPLPAGMQSCGFGARSLLARSKLEGSDPTCP